LAHFHRDPQKAPTGGEILWPLFCALHASRRLTHDQLRLQHYLGWVILVRLVNARKEAFHRLSSHLLQRLANRCKSRHTEASHTDIVEADNRDVLRAMNANIGKGSDSANCGRVVEGADSRKI
jgi:hypothetical protein